MPVRNGALFLSQAIESVLAQTIEDLELVIVDDGSTDETPSLLAEAARGDARVRVIRTSPRGLTPALNTAWESTTAAIIARMDADDVCYPDRLERQLAILEQRPEIALVAGGVVVIDARGNVLERAVAPPSFDLMTGNAITHSTVALRREALDRVGGYRVDQAEDYDLWLRIDERYGITSVTEPILRLRLHETQFSVEKLAQQAMGALAVREAARRRRSGGADPLEDHPQIGRELVGELGIDDATLNAQIDADAVHWGAVLYRIGRDGEARLLSRAAAAETGTSVATLRVRFQLRRLKMALVRVLRRFGGHA